MYHVPSWAAGLVLAPAVSGVAYRAGALSARGAVAATAVGAAAMAAGWSWGALLIAYFAGSSLLSRWRAAEKEARTAGRVEKPGARDATQVLANGALFGVLAIASAVDPRSFLWQVMGAGALSASAADTWATEIGVLSRQPPRSIVGFGRVEPGTSGGVTAQGFLGAAAGAAFVTIVAAAVRWPAEAIFAAFAGGLFGCLADSVAGATLQARRRCPACDLPTEAAVHRCGTPTSVTGGLSFVNNDAVNFLATLSGALFGAAVVALAV